MGAERFNQEHKTHSGPEASPGRVQEGVQKGVQDGVHEVREGAHSRIQEGSKKGSRRKSRKGPGGVRERSGSGRVREGSGRGPEADSVEICVFLVVLAMCWKNIEIHVFLL